RPRPITPTLSRTCRDTPKSGLPRGPASLLDLSSPAAAPEIIPPPQLIIRGHDRPTKLPRPANVGRAGRRSERALPTGNVEIGARVATTSPLGHARRYNGSRRCPPRRTGSVRASTLDR